METHFGVYVLLAVFGLVLGCSFVFTTPVQDTLLTAPHCVEIEGRKYVLEAHLWRNFMPGPDISSDGGPLTVIVWITALDSMPFPSSISADTVWVINGEEIWRAVLLDERPPTSEVFKSGWVARGGPKWEPGASVTVIVRLIVGDADTVSPYLLRTEARVERVD